MSDEHSKPTTADRLKRDAMQAVLDAPFWGPHPESNRWGDLDYEDQAGRSILFGGEAVALAFRNGWLMADQHDEPGMILPDPEDGGAMEMHWRFHAVPAWRTIIAARLDRRAVNA